MKTLLCRAATSLLLSLFLQLTILTGCGSGPGNGLPFRNWEPLNPDGTCPVKANECKTRETLLIDAPTNPEQSGAILWKQAFCGCIEVQGDPTKKGLPPKNDTCPGMCEGGPHEIDVICRVNSDGSKNEKSCLCVCPDKSWGL